MSDNVKTSIMLPREILDLAKDQAEALGVPMSAMITLGIVRFGLDYAAYLAKDSPKTARQKTKRAFLRAIEKLEE